MYCLFLYRKLFNKIYFGFDSDAEFVVAEFLELLCKVNKL